MIPCIVTCTYGNEVQQYPFSPVQPKAHKRVRKTGDPNNRTKRTKAKAKVVKIKVTVWNRIDGVFNAAKRTTEQTGKVLGLLVSLSEAVVLVHDHLPVLHHAMRVFF